MSRMGKLYAVHGCDAMTPAQLLGLQSLMIAPAGGAPLTVGELGALHASPKLRSWLVPQLGAFGSYVLHAMLEGREPVSLLAFLGEMRAEIASAVHS